MKYYTLCVNLDEFIDRPIFLNYIEVKEDKLIKIDIDNINAYLYNHYIVFKNEKDAMLYADALISDKINKLTEKAHILIEDIRDKIIHYKEDNKDMLLTAKEISKKEMSVKNIINKINRLQNFLDKMRVKYDWKRSSKTIDDFLFYLYDECYELELVTEIWKMLMWYIRHIINYIVN